MHSLKIILPVIILCVGLVLPLQAQKIKRYFPIFTYDTDTLNEGKNKELNLVPILYRSPETGIATGLVAFGLFKIGGGKDTNVRTSNISMPLVITQLKQYVFWLQYNLIFPRENLFWRGVNIVQRFNEYYYGIGNEAKSADKELIEYNLMRINQRLLFRAYKRHFIGPQYQAYYTWNLTGKEVLAREGTVGNKGYFSSGLGASYFYDSRDNIVASYSGTFVDIGTYLYAKAFGSDYLFTNTIIDLRKFVEIRKNNILAFQLFGSLNEGDVPFMQIAHIGGPNNMRGYYFGRYRDKILTTFQAEYRLPLFWKFGMVAFGGVGNVAKDFQVYDFNNIKIAGGTGLRYLINKYERVNIRFDVGFTNEGMNFYLNVGEAF